MVSTDYIVMRNKFVPIAENYADAQTTKLRWYIKLNADRESWAAVWNSIYHKKMKELTKNL